MNNSRQFGKNVFTFVMEVGALAVWIAAIAAFLFYLNAIPVKFALILYTDGRPGFGAGLAPFEGRFALRSANRRARGAKKRPARKKNGRARAHSAALHGALKAGRYLLRHLKLDSLRVWGRVSMPDAAQTALLCGCARALEGALAPIAPPGAVRFSLQPDFSGGNSDVTLCGMVSLRTGHIILAALIGAWNTMLRRIQHGKTSH